MWIMFVIISSKANWERGPRRMRKGEQKAYEENNGSEELSNETACGSFSPIASMGLHVYLSVGIMVDTHHCDCSYSRAARRRHWSDISFRSWYNALVKHSFKCASYRNMKYPWLRNLTRISVKFRERLLIDIDREMQYVPITSMILIASVLQGNKGLYTNQW